MESLARAAISVKGRVQGVFFRQTTKEKADSLGLSGWVRNQPDGSVFLEAAGARDVVEALIRWCHHGPPSARVDNVDVEWLEEPAPDAVNKGFKILRDW